MRSYKQLVELRNLQNGLDDIIESACQRSVPFEESFDDIYLFIKKKLGVNGFFIKLKDGTLIDQMFPFGFCFYNSEEIDEEPKSYKEPTLMTIDGCKIFMQPLDIVGTKIGKIGISYNSKYNEDEDYVFDILYCISELLDDYCLFVCSGRLKDKLYYNIQSLLKNSSFDSSMVSVVNSVKAYVQSKKLLIVYTDKQLTGSPFIRYIYFVNNELVASSFYNSSPELDAFVHSENYCLHADLNAFKKLLGERKLKLHYMRSCSDDKEIVGYLVRDVDENNLESNLSESLYAAMADSVNRRLFALNLERNRLRKFFSNIIVEKLIQHPDYANKYLTARNSNIGILFADITGFTKISEQVLKTPSRITSFIYKWSTGVVKRVFPLGGCLDKLVGDCVIFLFGPPFYEMDKETIAHRMLVAANLIRDYTKKFFARSEYKDLRKFPEFNNFGVSIGINFCSAVVGLIGPNEGFTAFSSGMNNTSRLQNIAEAYEILVSHSVYKLAQKSNRWNFSEALFSSVKNVKAPLQYYRLEGYKTKI